MLNTSNILSLLVILAMLATAGTLVLGLVGMFLYGPSHTAYSNKMMRLRVLWQGAALILFAMLMTLGK